MCVCVSNLRSLVHLLVYFLDGEIYIVFDAVQNVPEVGLLIYFKLEGTDREVIKAWFIL